MVCNEKEENVFLIHLQGTRGFEEHIDRAFDNSRYCFYASILLNAKFLSQFIAYVSER